MADQKITSLQPLAPEILEANDCFVVVDKSDTSMAPTGTNKSATLQDILAASPHNTEEHRFVVGNVLEGDTEDDVDFLDPGDGSGLRAALDAANIAAAAGDAADVFIRSGIYDLNLGAIDTLEATGINVFGAGSSVDNRSGTTIIGDRANRTIISLFSGSLNDVRLEIVSASPASTTVAAVVTLGTTQITNVQAVFIESINNNDTLQGVFAGFFLGHNRVYQRPGKCPGRRQRKWGRCGDRAHLRVSGRMDLFSLLRLPMWPNRHRRWKHGSLRALWGHLHGGAKTRLWGSTTTPSLMAAYSKPPTRTRPWPP